MVRGCGDDVEMIVVVVSVICPKACCKSGSIDVARSLLAPTLRPPVCECILSLPSAELAATGCPYPCRLHDAVGRLNYVVAPAPARTVVPLRKGAQVAAAGLIMWLLRISPPSQCWMKRNRGVRLANVPKGDPLPSMAYRNATTMQAGLARGGDGAAAGRDDAADQRMHRRRAGCARSLLQSPDGGRRAVIMLISCGT